MPSGGSEVQLPFTETGVASNSSSATSGLDINGLSTAEAKAKVSQGSLSQVALLEWLMLKLHVQELES